MSVNFAKVTMMGLTSMGIIFEKADSNRVYLSVPEFSDYYKENSKNMKDGESMARRVKELLRADMHNEDLRVFSRIRTGEHWTRKQGEQAAKEFLWSV